ncbi:IclR family transcriptional regulator [Blastococcus sp. MG754426]|uniref:IclR family transcriptional regulator domain-containing protein n=1 Tax=unclassified Blastococcus TaxID=2619396 RepID=UPI001EEFC9FD|nr:MULTISPECIES: IclR family transcriptional regulator C-terminal domain-containing protein [unclassified Blastococcus]MCF6508115.1 IclR family transcriptional regulator [Blastococcus sp. MG754426]MCF6511556.1 IclR family transcriptional regulator [Blastococcus sp. MG754427]
MRTNDPAADDRESPVDDGRPREFVQSLDRGLAVIRSFSAENRELTLSEVAQHSGLTRAAARRFLLTLEELDYVGSNGRHFFLKPKVLDLAYAYLSSFSATQIAQSHLEDLSARLQESCSMSVLDGGDIVHTAQAATNRIMTIGMSVGRRLPAFATSMGRVLLAALPPEELDARLANYERPKLTPRTVTDEEELRQVLATVRKRGWALLDQELEEGVRSVAAPVRDASGRVVAAINVSAHASRVSAAKLRKEFLPELLATADSISRVLAAHR